jgi:hypothetical protein
MQDVEVKTPGNAEVIAGLEAALARAKTGVARAAAIVFCEYAGADVMYMGDVQARAQVLYGCTLLNHLIITGTSNHLHHTTGSPQNPAANLWKFDLTADPICFDFLPWLVSAEMTRRREGAPAPLRVAFVRNPNSLVTIEESKWKFFHNVIRPVLSLFGAVEDEAAAVGRHADFVAYKDISKWHQAGEEVPVITVPDMAKDKMDKRLKGRTPVTITLREMDRYEQRNSDIDEWKRFARWLKARGEDVIVVRDTAKAGLPFDRFEICPEASEHIHARAALYAKAKCNLFVANGPWGLAEFSKVPWLMFCMVDEAQVEGFNRPDYWKTFMGMTETGQVPWATPQQRIVYKRDRFQHLCAGYEALQL